MKQSKIILFLSAFFTLGFTSCLKEHQMNIDPSKSTSLVAFENSGSNVAGASSVYPGYYKDLGTLTNGQSSTFNINVGYSGTEAAPEDITVNFALDTAVLATYNAQNGTNYIVPAADVFSLPPSVVIKKGERMAQTQVKISVTDNFKFEDAYALPLAITSASNSSISSNFGKAVYSFGVRNIYDGHYSLKGYTLRAADAVKTGNFVRSSGMDLQTVGATAVQFAELQVWADLTGVGVGNPVISVNPDNTVTLSSDGGIMNAPGYNSHYEPDTKTFYISFTWGAGPSARLATDTLTYSGPR